jgi:hypothetical protein
MNNQSSKEESYFSCLRDGEGEYLYKALTKDSSQRGKDAFEKLCRIECDPPLDPHLLADSLVRLCQTELIILSRTGEKVPIRPLDSCETELDGLSPDDLEKIADKARELQKDIIRLNNTRLVQRLIRKGIIAREDLLNGSSPDARFDGVLKLPEIARQYGPQKRPEYTQHLIIRPLAKVR